MAGVVSGAPLDAEARVVTAPISLAVAIPLVLLMAHAAWTDIVARRIANRTSLAIAILLPVRAILEGSPLGFAGHVAGGALVLAVGHALWSARLFGGGDVKLTAALALHVGPELLLQFVLHTALLGGLLGLAYLTKWSLGALLARLAPASTAVIVGLSGRDRIDADRSQHHSSRPSIPYGVAIVAGAASCIFGG